jgi:hypothetical protein
MFKKKTESYAELDAKVEAALEEAKVSHPNPHSDPVCAGCNKPINVPTVRDEFGLYHNQHCQAERK